MSKGTAKIDGIELKEATSIFEKKLLGIVDEQRKSMLYGKISLEIMITNGKIVLVELATTKKTYKLD